ncbi:SusC/RagA family TonB-linked outer membrane protein [Arcticibacter eurypsychrophilus]|uniref:SusC/RagA family TonB-linked outer membrane protein n=1 Tax=Arcticibacter eurypsychrophilus TaxID=1434752 RepID=UPI00147B6C89|nr:TonB-dependent receptor [Arcticibacter eurypsychrophilus]
MKQKLLFKDNSKYFRAVLALMLTILTLSSSFAQGKRITGNVSDDSGPIIGTSVRIKGTTQGTITGLSGEYSINAPENSTLVFSFTGYVTQEIAVGNRSTINITLVTDSKSLQEVVVIGYGTANRKDLTGSVSSVSSAQIEKVPVASLDQALQGRSSGVQVTNNDGAPGSGVTVLIRGVGSLGNNEPLYVVDGYPVTGGLNNINPNDIATMDILKDASATAIYGVRASNGVVIITTKKGSKNGVQVALDAYNSFQSEPKKYKVLNAEQWATLANETPGFSRLPEWSNPSALRNINWQDEVYRTGLRQNYNLAVRGGNEKVQSAFSAGYFDQKGVVTGSFFKRMNLGMNIDYTATKWLKSSSSAKYSRQDNLNPFGTGALATLSELIPTFAGNKLTSEAKDSNGNYGFFDPVNTYTRGWGNPLYTIETQDSKNLSNYFLGTTSLEASLFDGFRIKTNFGINTSDYSGYYFTPSDTRSLAQYNVASPNILNTYSQSANNTYEWLWENTISYTKTFGLHALDIVGGISQQENTFRQVGGNGNSLISDAMRDLGQVKNLVVFGNQQKFSLASQFGRVTYKYNDRYIFTATVRRDGSSNFYKNNQYGVFPSASIGWKAKEESFLKDVDFISDLKFRGSWGEVGNYRGIRPFLYLARYSSGGPASSGSNVGYPFGGTYQDGLAYVNLDNEGLSWETSRQTNFGMDAGFLNNDLTLTLEYYRKDSKDFLLPIPTASQSGVTISAQNAGSIRNQGLEASLNYRHTIEKFSYGLGLSFTTVDNKLLSISKSTAFIGNLVALTTPANGWAQFSQTNIGQPVGEFYGYVNQGIFQTQAEIDALNKVAPDGNYQGNAAQPTQPGDRKFKDINGDGQITADDRTSLGSPIPKFYGGFNLDFSYKAFDFNAFFYGTYGNKIFNYQARNLESFQAPGFVGIQNVSQEYYENRWTSTNPSNRFARVNYNDDVSANNVVSSIYVENGSYLRLRNVTLGYTLPAALGNKLTLSKVRLYVAAQNLFTITKYSGLDPEIGQPTGTDPNNNNSIAASPTASGIDIGTYPSSRFYTVGLNVTF